MRQKRKRSGSSGGSEREVERLNERCRKPMKHNFHRWGGGRASIAGEPFCPGESPMSTLCTGFERRGMRLRVNERFRGLNGDQHSLRSQELDKGLDTVRATDRGGNGQCGRHTARARSRYVLAYVLAQRADGLLGSAASHRVAV